jgi:hypothetical protein
MNTMIVDLPDMCITDWIRIHCTYCWRIHYAPDLDYWMRHNRFGCGKDPNRYFFTHGDYIAYAREYTANGC